MMNAKGVSGRHTTTLLREMVNRIVDQCLAEGREDLVAGVFLLEDLAKRCDRALLSQQRRVLLEILSSDDIQSEAGESLYQHYQDLSDAVIERATSTVQ